MSGENSSPVEPQAFNEKGLKEALSEKTIKKLLAKGKQRGYITYEELNEVLPEDKLSSEQIEDIMSMISEMGINVVEDDETEQEEKTKVAKPEDEEDELDDAGHVPQSDEHELQVSLDEQKLSPHVDSTTNNVNSSESVADPSDTLTTVV